MSDLAEQVQRLAQRIESLELQNAQLRAELGAKPGTTPEPARKAFDRRALLRLGGVASAMGAGALLLRASPAAADTGAMVYGDSNDAGDLPTSLTSASDVATFDLQNTNAASGVCLQLENTEANNVDPALRAIADGLGGAIYAEQTNADSFNNGTITGVGLNGLGGLVGDTIGTAPGVLAKTSNGVGNALAAVVAGTAMNADAVNARQNGLGYAVYGHTDYLNNLKPAIYGRTVGKANAINGAIANGTSTASAIKGTTTGPGAAIEGYSTLGQGGRFAGKTAQIQLVPSTTASSHPSSGAPGQLFVDKSKRLWFCRGGTSWKQLA